MGVDGATATRHVDEMPLGTTGGWGSNPNHWIVLYERCIVASCTSEEAAAAAQRLPLGSVRQVRWRSGRLDDGGHAVVLGALSAVVSPLIAIVVVLIVRHFEWLP